MEELERCPFCGGEADMWTEVKMNTYEAEIFCEDCSAKIIKRQTFSSSSRGSIARLFLETENEVIMKWNRRS